MIGGIPITKQQRYLAGRTDLVALLRSRGETLKRLGSEWEWKFNDERVTIRNNVWFDQYTQKGGDAVDFFRYFYGESEEQAAAMLLNCPIADLEKLPTRSPPMLSHPKQEEPKQLEIPPAHKDMRRVFAYLCQTRDIAPEVVSAFARKGLLYESASHHNAVFVGRDEQGKIRHLHARGTLTGSCFRQTLPGSEKNTAFTGKAPVATSTLSRPPSTFSPTFLCTQRGGRITPMWPCAGWALPPSTICWRRGHSWRKLPCAWTTMRQDIKPPAESPANCCGNGTSPCPLSSPRSKIGTMNSSPFARRKNKG